MKKVFLTLLAIVLIVGALGAAGFAGYQYGFRQGALSASKNDSNAVVPGFGFNPHGMPMHNFGFDRGFERGFGPGGSQMMGRGGMGFGFFSPIIFLARIAFWVLVIWAIYMLINRSGWRLTKTQTAPVAVTPAPVDAPDEKKES